ncbi:MAG: hypothetical protein ACYTG7_20095 [Planctomycetota bacterium]|jgi:hypothetical protein
MKTSIVCSLLAVVHILAATLSAEVPEIKAGVHLMDGGAYLEVGRHATPTSMDWNNDGKKDLSG